MDPWVEPGDLVGCDLNDDAHASEACQVATEVLYELSGQRYGLTTVDVRPSRLVPSCACGSACGCGEAGEIVFSRRVAAVSDVVVDGVALAPSDYVLVDGVRLVRVGGSWPCCPSPGASPGGPGWFSMRASYGTPVPQGGITAARVFACWIAKQIKPGTVELPVKTVQSTRQGVTVQILDPQQFIKARKTPIPLVNMWLTAVNPEGHTSSSSVVSPDTMNLPSS